MRTTLAAALLLALPLTAASATPPTRPGGLCTSDPAGDVELGSTGVMVPADHVDIRGFDFATSRREVVVQICFNGPTAPARAFGFVVSITTGRGVALAVTYQPCGGKQVTATSRNGNVVTVRLPITVTGSHPRVISLTTKDYVSENGACAPTGLNDSAAARP
jgi:hypothetical protein